MKLVKLNPSTHRTAGPEIRVSKSGAITINASAVEFMKLKKEYKIPFPPLEDLGEEAEFLKFDLYEDEENKGSWYLHKNPGNGALKARQYKGVTSGSCQFQCRLFSDAILKNAERHLGKEGLEIRSLKLIPTNPIEVKGAGMLLVPLIMPKDAVVKTRVI